MIGTMDRDIGLYGISIGTSFALEGVFHTGEFHDPTDKRKDLKDKLLMVNIRTLIRNAINCYRTEHKHQIDADIIYPTLVEDINGIIKTVSQLEPTCEVKFYHCSYKSADNAFPNVNNYSNDDGTGKPTSAARKLQRDVELDIFERSYDDLKEETKAEFVEFDCELSTKKPTVLLTHYPADLLSADNMPSCLLLESHTGKVKGPSEWTSKLTGKPSNLPFTKMIWSLFGDGIHIGPQPIKMRRVLLKLAEKYKWNHRTTDSRIIEGVKFAGEPHLVTLLRKWR